MSTKQSNSIFTTAFQSYHNETSALTVGYIYEPFKAPNLYLRFAQVLPSMIGKEPAAGQKVYDYDSQIFVSLNQAKASLIRDAYVTVAAKQKEEVVINLTTTLKVGVAQAHLFEGVSNPAAGTVVYVNSNNSEVVHYIESGSVAEKNLLYILETGFMEVVCGSGAFISEVIRVTMKNSQTPGRQISAPVTSNRRRTADDSSIPAASADLLSNFQTSSETSFANLTDTDLPPTNF
jgi:hypothetical protein